MFFIIGNYLSKALPKSTVNAVQNILARSATFSVKDFLYETHGDTGTLNTRFVKYLAMESSKFDQIIPQTIKYADYYPVQDIRSFNSTVETVPIKQIPRLIIFTYTYKTNGNTQKVAQVLNKIDEICVSNIEEFDYETLLKIIYAFMFVIPNKITKLEFYECAMRRLVKEFKPSFPKERFVQICFYIGLSKRNMQSNKMMNQLLSSHLGAYLPQMSDLDFAIVSNSAYKTSLVVNDAAFNERLIHEIEKSDCKDDALLVSFVKSIRLNRIKSSRLCEKLKTDLLSGKMDRFHFKGLTHCFAYFSENSWNDPEVCETFVSKCLDRLKQNDEFFNDMRAKDLATFLWCCANLGLDNLNASDLKLLENLILKKVDNGEFTYCPDDLIDAALSLWMLGYKSREIITEVSNLRINRNSRNPERVKLDSRLNLLLNCVQIEKKDWLQKRQRTEKCFIEDKKAPDYLTTKRKDLLEISQILEEHKQELGVSSNSLVCPISELNVPGILLECKHGKGYLEIVEPNQLLKFSSKLAAIVQLKISLLKSLGYKVQVVIPSQCKSTEELLDVLKESINSFEDATQLKEALA